MPAEMKEVNDAIGKVVTELRKEVEVVGKGNSETLDKIKADMATLEASNQELVAKKVEDENKVRAMEEKAELAEQNIKVLEKLVARGGTSNSVKDAKAYMQSPEFKAYQAFAMNGRDALSSLGSDIDFKTLRTDVATDGGVLVPEGMADFILKEVEELSPIDRFARSFTSSEKSVTLPVRTSIPTAAFEGELETDTDTTSKYRMERFVAYAQAATVPFSRDISKFSKFDIEKEVSQDVSLAFAQGANRTYLTGTGNKQPFGILTDTNVIAGASDTAASGAIDLDDVIKLISGLKVGYNGQFYFNLNTLVDLRTQKDSNGNYLWRIGGETMPTQISGFNYAIMQDMPDVAIGAIPVIFADLFMGYTIYNASGMEMIRDEVTQKNQRAIELTFFRWLTGQVTIAEAIKGLNVKA